MSGDTWWCEHCGLAWNSCKCEKMERPSGQMDGLARRLGFRITDVQIGDDKVLRRLDYVSSGCRPATAEECKLWDMLALISWKRRII